MIRYPSLFGALILGASLTLIACGDDDTTTPASDAGTGGANGGATGGANGGAAGGANGGTTGGANGGAQAGSDAGSLQTLRFPCAIETAIKTNCLGCHAKPKGKLPAFSSYDVVHSDFEGAPLWKKMEAEVTAGNMPPPDKRTISADDKKLLMDWFAGGAPAASLDQECK